MILKTEIAKNLLECVSVTNVFAFIKNILSFIANQYLYALVSSSFLHSEGDIPVLSVGCLCHGGLL